MEFGTRPGHRNTKAIRIRQFREKPSLAVAQRYVRSERVFWNSGMFFWKASTFREELRKHLPGTASVLREIAQRGQGTGKSSARPKLLPRVLKELYPACENISVDYAVLEKAQHVLGIPCDF